MQDHGLFQAICRVNRLDGESKEFGYIVDYKALFLSLGKAVKSFSRGKPSRIMNPLMCRD